MGDGSGPHRDGGVERLSPVTALEIILRALNQAARRDPESHFRTLEAATWYEAATAAILSLIILMLAESRELLPPLQRLSDERDKLRASVSSRSESACYQTFKSWRRILGIRAGLGCTAGMELVGATPNGTSVLQSALVDALPVDTASLLLLLDLVASAVDRGELGLEDIGRAYEQVRGYTAERATEILLCLKGRGNTPSVVSLAELESHAERGPSALREFLETQTGRSPAALRKDLDHPTGARATIVSTRCGDDSNLGARITPFAALLSPCAHGADAVVLPGDIYLKPSGERRRTGIHYTPPPMVDVVVRHTLDPLLYAPHQAKSDSDTGRTENLRSVEEILRLKICDIAMGCGAFLLQACRYLGDRVVEASCAQARGGGTPATGGAEETGSRNAVVLDQRTSRQLVAQGCLHGVDSDPLAVELARVSLWLLIGLPAPPPAGLSRHLRCGDAVVGMHSGALARGSLQLRHKRQDVSGDDTEPAETIVRETECSRLEVEGHRGVGRPFHWPLEFPEVVLASEGFDAIIGNPPFGNAIEGRTARDPAFNRYARQQFGDFARGANDYCLLFWARALLHLLSPRGRYGWLSPTSLLSEHKPWQAWVHAHARPTVLALFPVNAFRGVRIRTSAFCGGRGQASHVLILDGERADAPRGVLMPWGRDLHCWYEVVDEAVQPQRRLPRKLGRCEIMLSELPLDLFAGSTAEVAYDLRGQIHDSRQIGGPCLVTTGTIDRYHCSWGSKPIRYLKADYRYPRWPQLPETSSMVARARDRQRGPKIIVGGLTAVIEAWLDRSGACAGTVSTWIIRLHANAPPHLLYLVLALLNSASFSRLYMRRHGAKSMSGKQTTIQKRALLEMPVPAALLSIGSVPCSSAQCGLEDEAGRLGTCLHAACVLQESAPDTARWSQLDKLCHIAAGLLYGLNLADCLDDYDWWCQRSGRCPDATAVPELVGLLHSISQESAFHAPCPPPH